MALSSSRSSDAPLARSVPMRFMDSLRDRRASSCAALRATIALPLATLSLYFAALLADWACAIDPTAATAAIIRPAYAISENPRIKAVIRAVRVIGPHPFRLQREPEHFRPPVAFREVTGHGHLDPPDMTEIKIGFHRPVNGEKRRRPDIGQERPCR